MSPLARLIGLCALSFAFLSGTSEASHIRTYAFDPKFKIDGISSKAVKQAFDEATNGWENVCDVEFKFSKRPMFRIKSADLGDHVLGRYNYITGQLWITNNPKYPWTYNLLVAVFEHELGHHMNLGHENDRNSIMYKYVYGQHIADIDIKNVRSKYGARTRVSEPSGMVVATN